MVSIIVALAAALLVTALATPLVRYVATRLQAVDEPTARRAHVGSVPRLGGLALVAGFFIPIAVLFVADTNVARLLFQSPNLVLGMAAGSALMAGLGAVDDLIGVSAKNKLLVQVAAAVLAYVAGFRILALYVPGVGVVEMGFLAIPATVLWIVAVINAVNLIDGLDGLAAGAAFFVCVTNFIAAYLGGNILICLFSATLAGSLLGFLFYNFNPATIFMGDTGSMFLGFLVATISLFGAGAYKGTTAIALFVPIVALGLPLMDMIVAMIRRFVARRSIFSPDRGHIHHRLVDAGLTHRRAVLMLYCLCVVFTAAALAVFLGRSWEIGLSLTALIALVVAVTRAAGYFTHALARSKVGVRQHSPDVECLRRAIPGFVARVERLVAIEQIVPLLEDFANAAGMTSVHYLAPTDHVRSSLLWESPAVSARSRSDAVKAVFELTPRPQLHYTMVFRWDSAEGEVSPQSDILLQLLCDAVEQALVRLVEFDDSEFAVEAAARESRATLRLAGQE